jgi:hypothetical protein
LFRIRVSAQGIEEFGQVFAEVVYRREQPTAGFLLLGRRQSANYFGQERVLHGSVFLQK